MSMVKLYNRSGLDSEVLERLLSHAAKMVGCRAGVVVKVTRGGERVRSYAYRRGCVSRPMLTGRGDPNRPSWVRTNCGWIKLTPRWAAYYKHEDYLRASEDLFEIAMHEFGHVRDWQRGEIFDPHTMAWYTRRQERRAEEYVADAKQRLAGDIGRQEIEGLILDLAISWEEWGKQVHSRRLRNAGRRRETLRVQNLIMNAHQMM